MRKSTLLAVCLMLFAIGFAQKDKNKNAEPGVQPFGEVSKEELLAKNSTLEKNAAAEVIFDIQELDIDISQNIETKIKIHRRIKIYNDKGLEYANKQLIYISKSGIESIGKIEAQTYNLDAAGNVVVTKMDKKSIYDKKLDNVAHQLSFLLPEVKAGSVIEYTYVLTSRRLVIQDHYFQQEIPVRYNRLRMNYPEELEITTRFHTLNEYKQDKKTENRRVSHTMSMANLPALSDEPYITCSEDYFQKVVIDLTAVYHSMTGVRTSLTRSWPSLIQDLMEDVDFGFQLKKNIPRTADLDAELSRIQAPYDKMTAIHKYVKKNMTWDGKYSLWALEGVKSAWASHTGNSGEINLILVNLLKDAGLKAYPILLSTRDNGMINTSSPGYYQFNTVMAYVQIGDKTFILDGTNQQTPSHMIPDNVMYSEGLVISKVNFNKGYGDQDWGWVTLYDDNQKYSTRSHITAKITPEGVMSGEAYVDHSGYAKIDELKCWKEGKEKFVENHYTTQYHGISVQDLAVSNIEKDSMPMSQKVKFDLPLSSSGEYSYFSVNMFCGLDKNPFIADQRVSDIVFGHNQQYTISGTVFLPDNYTIEELPKNTRMIMPDTSIIISRMAQLNGNTLQYRITLEYKKPAYSPTEYEYIWDFHKKMYALLNEQVVLKKKS